MLERGLERIAMHREHVPGPRQGRKQPPRRRWRSACWRCVVLCCDVLLGDDGRGSGCQWRAMDVKPGGGYVAMERDGMRRVLSWPAATGPPFIAMIARRAVVGEQECGLAMAASPRHRAQATRQPRPRPKRALRLPEPRLVPWAANNSPVWGQTCFCARHGFYCLDKSDPRRRRGSPYRTSQHEVHVPLRALLRGQLASSTSLSSHSSVVPPGPWAEPASTARVMLRWLALAYRESRPSPLPGFSHSSLLSHL